MKVGDKVKYLGGSKCCWGFNVGDVLTVKCIDRTGYYPIKVQNDNGFHGYCAKKHLAPLYKFKVGDKVVPIAKTVGRISLDMSYNWNEARATGQNFLYVNELPHTHDIGDPEYDAYICGRKDGDSGDYFMESDLIPYVDFEIGDKVVLLPYRHGDVVENGECKKTIVDDKAGEKGTIDDFDSDGNAIVYLDIYPKYECYNSYTIKPSVLKKAENQMTKDQLKTGMWVVTRSEGNYMVAKDGEKGSFLINRSECVSFTNINNDLTCLSNHDFDIMKVYGSRTASDMLNTNLANKKLLWTRPAEVKEVSKDEAFKILKKKFGCDIKITE
jgi:hypothetical protein